VSGAIPFPLNPRKWPWRRGADEAAEDVAPRFAGAQAAFGGGDQEGEWVTVYIAFGPEEAHIVRQSLMVRDIPAIMRVDGLDTVVGTTLGRGVRVLVPRALEDRAREILQGADAIDDQEAYEDPASSREGSDEPDPLG
jgi:hypothetical protein